MSSTEAQNEITIRRAAHADCDTIQNMNRNVYGGNDYFIFSFHRAVAKENRFPHVAELQGDIVGYTCGHVIDDGEAIVMETARVSEKHQGRQIVNMLSGTMVSAAVSKFPNLRKALWTSSNPVVSAESMRKHPYIERGDVKHVLIMEANPAALKGLCESKLFCDMEKEYRVSEIHAVPKREALGLLTDEIQFLSFAPKIPIIMWEPSGWHKSTLAEQLQDSDLHITKCQQSGKVRAFRFDSVGQTNSGVHCFVDIFSVTEGSFDLVLSHMLWHIRQLSVMQKCDLICSVHFPSHLVKDDVRKVLDGLGVTLKPEVGLQTVLLGADLAAMFAPKTRL